MPIEIERPADVFVDVADTLVADFDLIEFLHAVARHATAITGGTAAGVLLSGQDGLLHHVGASDEDTRLLELFQIQTSEGPCLDCYRAGGPVVVPDLTQARDRWPSFTPRALAVGMTSVYARAEVLTEQLQAALTSRIVVEQARGAVPRAYGISVDEAFKRLRSHARGARRRLTDVAHEVVTSPAGPELLGR